MRERIRLETYLHRCLCAKNQNVPSDSLLWRASEGNEYVRVSPSEKVGIIQSSRLIE